MVEIKKPRNKQSNMYAGDKILRVMRILVTVDVELHAEAKRLGFDSYVAYINHHFTEYFKSRKSND